MEKRFRNKLIMLIKKIFNLMKLLLNKNNKKKEIKLKEFFDYGTGRDFGFDYYYGSSFDNGSVFGDGSGRGNGYQNNFGEGSGSGYGDGYGVDDGTGKG